MVASREDVKRAMTHQWVELNDQYERCSVCLVILHKSTPAENIEACTGRPRIRRFR